MKKQSKQSISKIQRDIWTEIKRIVRRDQPNVCYTCGQRNLDGANWHCGHMWSKASLGAFLKYDLRIIRSQCYRCNIFGGGMGADFYRNMLKEIGKKKMEQLEKDRQKTVKAYDFYFELLQKLKSY